ncbi:MAG: DHA2 family efflux MFS transporter permease subunit [Ectothiorhodospiraceae bacterium]|nr:DHA2 family efflux MFS transporter permease subunit [Ectothiorhodospiraceae bacterium]
MPPPAPTVESDSRIGLRHWLILALVQVTTLTFGMTITATNVVLPQMKGALSATQDQIAWVVTFYLVAAAVGTPLTGWMAGWLGWRRLMVWTLTGFTVSSALCGLAGSLETLVPARVAQGFFGAPLMPLGQAVLLATFPRHMHPLVLMLWGVGGVMGPVLGPLVGGTVAELADWRWAFFVMVPLGMVSIAIASVSLGDQERGTSGKLDWVGFGALAIAVSAAQLMLDRGHRLDWFDSTEIVVEAVVAALGLYVFVVHTLTARKPFLSPGMFTDRNFTLGILMAFAMGTLSYTPIVLFPPLLQDLRNYPDAIVGYLMSARGIGNFLSFLVVVQFTRYNAKLALGTGILCQVLAGWAMARLDINMSSFDVFWTNLLQGFGFGLAYTPMTALAFSTLAPRYITEGSAVFNLMRNFGSSLFISISVLVLVRSTAANYAGLSELVSPFNEALRDPAVAGSWTTETASGLAALSAELRRQAQMVGYLNAFWLFTVTALLSLPLVCLFSRPTRAR